MKAILIVALLAIGACSVKAGDKIPPVFQPLGMGAMCALHYDWQCNNTYKFNLCSGERQCVIANGVAI